MNRITARIKRYTRRKRSVRKNIFGVPTKPRLSLTRTGKNMYAQLIDDTSGRTLCSASTIEKDGKMAVIVMQQNQLAFALQKKRNQ